MPGIELEFVEWLEREARRRHTGRQGAGGIQGKQRADGSRDIVQLGIGDDMAVVEAPGGRVLISSDMLLDGVHFDAKRDPLPQIGRKAVACGLSDCAAMAVRPMAATLSVAIPAAWSHTDARQLLQGAFDIADEFGLAIVGGDTTSWGHPLAVDVAVTAIPYEGVEPVTRSGARPGDTLVVTGGLGGSLLGRHLSFTPRVREARMLAAYLGDRLHAMIDISDGLALDLWRVCRASKVGATLDQHLLESVISDDAVRVAAADARMPLDHALSDGEDFELLLSVDGDGADAPVKMLPVGEVTTGNLVLRCPDGRTVPLEPKGYVH